MKLKTALAFALILVFAAARGQAQDPASKLSIHGHLTQAYAESDGHQLLGIGSDGTTNYRTAALQFRYDLDEKHSFVIQFSHEELGDSPYNSLHEDLELDLAFYQYSFDSNRRVKVGKAQIPWGIYNEIRDVGTVLPFYRPPVGVYLETLQGVESLDGVIFANSFGSGDWGIDADVYYGGWDFLSGSREQQRAQDAVGAQIWLRTPLPGLRLGAAYRESDSLQLSGANTGRYLTTEEYLLSADASFGRALVRAEYLNAGAGRSDYTSYYGQLGFHVNDKISIYGQVEYTDLILPLPFAGLVDLDTNDDVAFAVTYSFGPALLRLEHHQNSGLLAEDLDPTQVRMLQPVDTDYFILSLSSSF